jgi:outer membrane protein TolC
MKFFLPIYLAVAPLAMGANDGSGKPAPDPVQPAIQTLSLDQCLEMALHKNRKRAVSQFGVAIAEAEHRQALAGYWPQITGTAGYKRLSDPINFIFPSSTFQIPAESITVPGGSTVVSIPANAFGPGFPPSSIQVPVAFPSETVKTPAQAFLLPQQNVKVLDQNLATGKVEGTLLLWDGGMRKGYREQANGFVAMMQQEARRTDLEIADSVRRMYWGAVLAKQLQQLGSDTLARTEATEQLTETMYKGGSGKVTKADYLDSEVMTETIRGMVVQLEKNETMAQAALANTMGLDWKNSVQPASDDIPYAPYLGGIDELVGTSYQFSPDWNKLEAGLRAAEGGVKTARSGFFPKLALTGELHRGWNGGFNQGLATGANLRGWSAGIGLEIPLFDGLLTHNRLVEARARLEQAKQGQFLLRDGIALQIKDCMLSLDAAVKTNQAAERAMNAARDNRDLNTRAYASELVETEKVIRAQLMEALMTAQFYKSRYDYVTALSQLSVLVGTEVNSKLTKP